MRLRAFAISLVTISLVMVAAFIVVSVPQTVTASHDNLIPNRRDVTMKGRREIER